MLKRTFALFILFLVMGCARGPIKKPDQAMRLAKSPMSLNDDLGYRSLIPQIENLIQFYKARPNFESETLNFGPHKVKRSDYVKSLKVLKKLFAQNLPQNDLNQRINDLFLQYEVYGKKRWGEVFITSYYQPVIKGCKYRTKKCTRPIYGIPKDLIEVDMSSFVEVSPELSPAFKIIKEKHQRGVLIGRAIDDGKKRRLVPYWTRKEIDVENKMRKQSKVFAWVDPVDIFFLQIQGSGIVEINKKNRFRIGYAGQNGHKYYAIGKSLLDKIPLEEMTSQAIKDHLRSLTVEERQEILNENPSYVFFQRLPGEAITFSGTEVFPGRTIATDARYFPKGVLAIMDFQLPSLQQDDANLKAEHAVQKVQRLVIDQDTGGAIRGPARVDLYWGEGERAHQFAGKMKNWGQLRYLVPKQELLENFDDIINSFSLPSKVNQL